MSRRKRIPKAKRKKQRRIDKSRRVRSGRKPRRQGTTRSKNRSRMTHRSQTQRRALRKKQTITDPRVVRALGFMRRTGASASEAAHRERMKQRTLVKRAGRYIYQSGRGKRWQARSEDQLAVSMSLLTRQGRITVIVPNSRERRLLHQYELAVNKFRAADDGAEEALKEFEGLTIAGHELVTDIKALVELEEGDELDYDNFYTDLGPKS